ncbi:hypothetical protein GOP47_0014259 [Adiantum capillus-veneris]|uniref:cytokinin dehydrogenase n=1 Tax=Adiantum capillus-veneris TaxID=13818 RepID=A0A9D4ULZ6_ADICA|nr:hypothetical protein GOP47_0014259 [Adiantum capillus-veneris]
MQENDVHEWVSDSRGSAMLLLLIISRLLVALGATFQLQISSVLNDAECAFLKSLAFEGALVFEGAEVSEASVDFGKLARLAPPRAVLKPASVQDIGSLVRGIYKAAVASNNNVAMTVAARGHGHSIHGQAQAPGGVVVDMTALRGIHVMATELYADVRGGELWIDVLQATLREGLAPKSWTDYLYLTVGGTLSNAGISGQAFLHGPQISNVRQLEVVTGKGDVVVCSEKEHSDLFYAALGGLGQFGIITSARIALEPAPQRVKWVRVLYSDFDNFRKDQEYLISQPLGKSFDYIEGFVVSNSENLLDNWRSSLFAPAHEGIRTQGDAIPAASSQSRSGGANSTDVVYYLEVTKNYREAEANCIHEKVSAMLAPLHCIPSSIYSTDISYVDFLNRVHVGEQKLRAKGLWDIPHPWLNLFIPASKIVEFDAVVFRRMLGKRGSGPIIIYPMNRNKWDARTSVAIPEGEDVFYLVALLRSPSEVASTEELLQQNDAILHFCRSAGIGEKLYLPRLSGAAQWRTQMGDTKWATFVRRKALYDPSAILSAGHSIFRSNYNRNEGVAAYNNYDSMPAPALMQYPFVWHHPNS